MRFMMLVKATPESEAAEVMPGPEVFEAMHRYNKELIKAGVLLAADGLLPSSQGFRVAFHGSGGSPTVTDGPFTETKELLAGYWVIDVSSREEAEEWAKRVPFQAGDVLEVRQVAETADFPEDVLPPEMAAEEQAWRDANQRPVQG
ncbi:YciI family protein [Kitasatospora camelliae]|uniref:YciI family protein n=1 Tax=Kitasatospora camelliae TaxID=3156397 RepID=A0AAU8JW45_9ACTN